MNHHWSCKCFLVLNQSIGHELLESEFDAGSVVSIVILMRIGFLNPLVLTYRSLVRVVVAQVSEGIHNSCTKFFRCGRMYPDEVRMMRR